MLVRIRQIVMRGSLCLVLSSGAAFAGKPGPIDTPVVFSSVCSASLAAAAVAVGTQAFYTAGTRWTVNRDALLTKLLGIDLKLQEEPPKPGDAMLIVGDILQKVDEWLGATKPKLTDVGALEIQRTVMTEAGDPPSVANCIQTSFGG